MAGLSTKAAGTMFPFLIGKVLTLFYIFNISEIGGKFPFLIGKVLTMLLAGIILMPLSSQAASFHSL